MVLFSVVKQIFLPFQNNAKNLDFWNCSGREKAFDEGSKFPVLFVQEKFKPCKKDLDFPFQNNPRDLDPPTYGETDFSSLPKQL